MVGRMSRRELLRYTGLGGCAVALAACQPKIVEVTKVVTQEKVVKETVVVAGTPQVVERVVQQTVIVVPTAPPTPKPGPVTINWIGPFVPPYRFDWMSKTLLARYKEVAPNVEVKLEQTTGWPDTEEKVLVRFAAGGGPDLAQTYYAPLDFAARKMWTAMNPYIEKDAKVKPEIFFTNLLRGGQYEGQTYCLPHNAITQIFFYNKKHFEAAGLKEGPKTQNEVAEFAKKLGTVAGVDFGLAVALTDQDTFAAYLYANGGRFMDDDCQRTFFADKPSVNTLTWVVDQVKAGTCKKHGSAADVSNGKVSMQCSVPWIVGWTKEYAPDIYNNLGAVLVPAGAGGNTSYSWAHYEGILANSKVKDATWAFLSWMLSDENLDEEWHNAMQFLPTQPRVFARKTFADHFAWSVFGKQLGAAKSVPPCVKWRAIATEALVPELEAAWLGQKLPAEALTTADTKAAKILGGK